MKLQTIRGWFRQYDQQLECEVRNLESQPYSKIYDHYNFYFFLLLIYMITSLVVGVLGIYGANHFIDVTGSYWLCGIFGVCSTIYKTTIILSVGLLAYVIVMVTVYRLVEKDQSEPEGDE